VKSSGWRGEAGDPADQASADRKDHRAVGAEVVAFLLLRVCSQRGLAVSRRGNEPDALEVALQRRGGEERANRCGTGEASRLRWRQQGIVRQQLDQTADVDSGPGLLKALQHPRLGASVGGVVHSRQASLAALARQPTSRTLQRAVHGRPS
jgi:hypothetical protein